MLRNQNINGFKRLRSLFFLRYIYNKNIDMRNLFNNISQEEKSRILEMHSGKKNVVKEDMFKSVKNFGKNLMGIPTYEDDNVERDENKIFDEIKRNNPDLFKDFDEPILHYLDYPRNDKRRKLAYRVFDSFDLVSKFGGSKKSFENEIIKYWTELNNGTTERPDYGLSDEKIRKNNEPIPPAWDEPKGDVVREQSTPPTVSVDCLLKAGFKLENVGGPMTKSEVYSGVIDGKNYQFNKYGYVRIFGYNNNNEKKAKWKCDPQSPKGIKIFDIKDAGPMMPM